MEATLVCAPGSSAPRHLRQTQEASTWNGSIGSPQSSPSTTCPAHEKEHLLSVSREVAHRVERKATPLAMYVLGLSVGSQMADRKRDDSIEDAIHALMLRLPDPEDA